MKLFAVVALLTLCLSGLCQTTNWVSPGPYLRISSGQLYNTYYSKKWDIIWRAAHSSVQPNSDPTATIAASVQLDQVFPDKLICSVFENYYDHDTYSGSLVLQRKSFVKTILIYNYPNAGQLITGQPISGAGFPENKEVRCLRVANYRDHNQTYEAYDCGLQYTNLVPVVKRR